MKRTSRLNYNDEGSTRAERESEGYVATEPQTRTMTAEEFERFVGEPGTCCELVDGEVVEMPPPGGTRADHVSRGLPARSVRGTAPPWCHLRGRDRGHPGELPAGRSGARFGVYRQRSSHRSRHSGWLRPHRAGVRRRSRFAPRQRATSRAGSIPGFGPA